MQFTKIVMALGLVTGISASPVSLEKKQQTAPQVVSQIVSTLSGGAFANLATINGLVQNIDNNVDASAAVVAVVNANLQAIKDGFDLATANLIAATTGTAGGVAAIGGQFAGQQITQLAADIATIAELARQIRVTAGLIVTNLAPDALGAVNAELVAVQAAVQPFVTPLQDLATAVRNANATAFFRIEGLRQAVEGLINVITGAVARLGKLIGQ